MVRNDAANQITLKVAETNPKLVGRGMAMVDPSAIEELGLSTGDIIELAGKRKAMFCSGLASLMIMARG
jgi:hypothetical protein